MDPLLLQGLAMPMLAQVKGLVGSGQRPVLALNGPVGAGKSLFCQQLMGLAKARGLRLAVASIDDAYLPWEQRLVAMAGNPFGVNRVPPGSHDAPLLLERLQRWRSEGVLQLPRFDKTRKQRIHPLGPNGRAAQKQTIAACHQHNHNWVSARKMMGITGRAMALPSRMGDRTGVTTAGAKAVRFMPSQHRLGHHRAFRRTRRQARHNTA